MEKTNIPVYRGESNTGQGTLKGSLLFSDGEWYIIKREVSIRSMIGNRNDYWYFNDDDADTINPETLEVSFDDEKTWSKANIGSHNG